MVKRNGKLLENYNSQDVRGVFTWLYSKKHNKEYVDRGFIGYDLKIIKEAIKHHGLFPVLAGFYNGVKNNNDNVSIKYIIRGFEFKYYLPDNNAEIYYKVMVYGTDKVKAYWRKYLLLNSKWFPTAASEQKKKKIIEKIKEWTNAQTE